MYTCVCVYVCVFKVDSYNFFKNSYKTFSLYVLHRFKSSDPTGLSHDFPLYLFFILYFSSHMIGKCWSFRKIFSSLINKTHYICFIGLLKDFKVGITDFNYTTSLCFSVKWLYEWNVDMKLYGKQNIWFYVFHNGSRYPSFSLLLGEGRPKVTNSV